VAEQPNPVDLSPFDDALAWGTGDRTSRQITATDVERAEHAHEASLDQVVHALPGLERAEVPMTAPHEAPPEGSGAGQPLEIAQELTGAGEAPRYEPIDEGREPSGIGGGSSAGGSRLSGDLPLIYPDEVAPPAEPFTRVPSRVGGAESQVSVFEPEPVVTETMAELYAGQGLVDQARETYRKLLAQRPGDAGLMQRLASLDPAAASAPRRTRVAGVTGGPSVRDFLSDVFAGRPSGEVTPPPPAPLVPADSPEPAPAAEVPIPESETTLLESAFEDSAGPSGEPTRRASDEVSLAAVFGEEPPPPKSAEAGEERHPPGKAFSFDEFFGTQRPSRESSASSADDDDFKRWLKSLKS
jgi:hypothetical protein